MKEKIRKILQNGGIFIMMCIIMNEFYNIYVDWYNFGQLEKAKPFLEKMDKNTKKNYTPQKFNLVYHSEIYPIKDCYYISNYNGNEEYIFGFKIYSKMYRFLYQNNEFVYPRYNIPPHIVYYSGGNGDGAKNKFQSIITHPCEINEN